MAKELAPTHSSSFSKLGAASRLKSPSSCVDVDYSYGVPIHLSFAGG